MIYQNELQFFCDTLRRSRVRALVTAPEEAASIFVPEMAGTVSGDVDFSQYFPEPPAPCTVYRLRDDNDLCYFYLLLPDTEKPALLLIGPYLTERPAPERLLELGRQRGIPTAEQVHFEEYYTSLPVLREDSPLLVMLSTFCERIWKSPVFAIVDVKAGPPSTASPINEPTHTDAFDDVLLHMKTMEQRYAYENELIKAVTLGQLHKENQLFSALHDMPFEKRLADPLRNAKNYDIIMNTLLRKAAEEGGVHPVYLDRVSSEFAAKIENLPELSENIALMREMFRSYCRLVRRHTVTHFSLVVQQTVLLIDSDLSAELSLKSLAQNQNVSPAYLSAVFKRDTGKTISEYIREKRIRHAEYLLANTHLQIQNIALYCGIMDVQYFSRTFKKLTGKTPKEYRESVNRTSNP